jgi:hypothetical protein
MKQKCKYNLNYTEHTKLSYGTRAITNCGMGRDQKSVCAWKMFNYVSG